MATILRANFGELIAPGLASVFFNEFDRWDKEWPLILKERDSKKKFEEELLITGMGIMDAKAESVPVTYDVISQGYKKTFTHTTFSKAIRISMEMYEDDLYGVMRDMTAALARTGLQRQEVDAANVLNNSFSSTAGTSDLGPDGVSLINSAHVLSVGGTQSNAMAANADLAVASLQEAIGILEKCKDERNLNIALKASTLVVPPDLQWVAAELLGSEYKPGTADNEVNAIKGKGLKYTVNHYLTNTNAWFLLADEHKLRRFTRVPLQFYKGNDFDTDDAKFKARMRYSVGATDWRGITGNAGT